MDIQNPEKIEIKKTNTKNTHEHGPLERPVQYYNRNQLNSSLSKMQYTFSKADRFNSGNNSITPNKYYDLPPVLRTQRSPSFGYGTKVQFGKDKAHIPSPSLYEIPRQFQSHSTKGSTMGMSREEIKFNDFFRNPNNMTKAEPASYNVSPNLRSPKYSIGERFTYKRKWIDFVPGPGNYNHQEPTSNLSSAVSNFRTSPGTKFPKTHRLKQVPQTKMFTPGPGNYDTNTTTIKKYGTVFGTEQRKNKSSLDKGMSPGPGTYSVFSQFLH